MLARSARRRVTLGTRVVDEHVQPAEVLHGDPGEAFDRLLVGHVCRLADSMLAERSGHLPALDPSNPALP